MPVDHDFVGTGWAFPPQLTVVGWHRHGAPRRELEESMRIILLTYPGERPMRPEFGSRVRDFVFRSVDDEMTTALAFEVKRALQRWEPRVDVIKVIADAGRRQPRTGLHRHPVRGEGHQRPPQPRVPVLHDPRRWE